MVKDYTNFEAFAVDYYLVICVEIYPGFVLVTDTETTAFERKVYLQFSREAGMSC